MAKILCSPSKYVQGAGELKKLGEYCLLYTSKKRASRLIHVSGVEHLIANAIYGDMVEHGKPEPDIFLKAAELIGQNPEECLVLEDSAPGLLAGKAAGGYTIYVPDMAVVPEEVKKGITA